MVRREGKSRFIAVTDRQEIALLLAGGLDAPHLFGGDESPYFTDADELRAWRELISSQQTGD